MKRSECEDSGLAHSLLPNWMLDLKSCVFEAVLPLDRILKGPRQAPLEGPILSLELTGTHSSLGRKMTKAPPSQSHSVVCTLTCNKYHKVWPEGL